MLRRPSAAALATIGRGAAAPGRYRSQHSRRALSSVPAAAAASSASSTLNPLVLTQDALAAVHAATGTPWWLVLGGSAIALRVAILPAVLLQVRETRRLTALMPQFAIFRQQTAAIEPAAERARVLLGKIRAECKARGVRPLRVVGLPLMQVPLLIGLVVAVRRMLLPGAPQREVLSAGGAYWFSDLTAPDPTSILPLGSLLLLVTNLQVGLTRPAATRGGVGLLSMLRNVFQAGSVVAFPFYAELPAGVFMYWVRRAQPRTRAWLRCCPAYHQPAWPLLSAQLFGCRRAVLHVTRLATAHGS